MVVRGRSVGTFCWDFLELEGGVSSDGTGNIETFPVPESVRSVCLSAVDELGRADNDIHRTYESSEIDAASLPSLTEALWTPENSQTEIKRSPSAVEKIRGGVFLDVSQCRLVTDEAWPVKKATFEGF